MSIPAAAHNVSTDTSHSTLSSGPSTEPSSSTVTSILGSTYDTGATNTTTPALESSSQPATSRELNTTTHTGPTLDPGASQQPYATSTHQTSQYTNTVDHSTSHQNYNSAQTDSSHRHHGWFHRSHADSQTGAPYSSHHHNSWFHRYDSPSQESVTNPDSHQKHGWFHRSSHNPAPAAVDSNQHRSWFHRSSQNPTPATADSKQHQSWFHRSSHNPSHATVDSKQHHSWFHKPDKQANGNKSSLFAFIPAWFGKNKSTKQAPKMNFLQKRKMQKVERQQAILSRSVPNTSVSTQPLHFRERRGRKKAVRKYMENEPSAIDTLKNLSKKWKKKD